MQLKNINRNEIIEHKKRLEKHKKAIESDIKDITQEKTAKESLTTKKNTIKKNTTKKKAAAKKAMKERQKVVEEKIMDDVRKGDINIEKNSLEGEHEEPKVVITKEERTERFKRLHAIARDTMNRWNK